MQFGKESLFVPLLIHDPLRLLSFLELLYRLGTGSQDI